MIESQTIILITPAELVAGTQQLRERYRRLVHIGATNLTDALQVDYAFDHEGQYTCLRLLLPLRDARVPSISAIYPCAFLYENELHDLFHLTVEGISVDYHGTLYTTSAKHPFAAPLLCRRRPRRPALRPG